MVFKILAFGLAALNLARAASLFQTPLISCNVNLGSSKLATAGNLEPAIPAGDYLIFNVATHSQVRSYVPNNPIFVSRTREFPGPFGTWTLKPADEDAFNIRNVGLGVYTFVDDDKNVISGDKKGPASFAVQPAGGNRFVIKVPNADLVWTVDPNTIKSTFAPTDAERDGDSQLIPVYQPQYNTGKTLGNGTYAIVQEAIHIKTGKEHMVPNEIAVLKRILSGNPNIVMLHDYFETSHNLYLCFDLCTGGELFDRICANGNYYEADAAKLVRTIFTMVKYIHSAGIVHRDRKPENLLFRTPANKAADVMITDFGLSRFIDDSDKNLLTDTQIGGTSSYMAPEILLKKGYGRPVDVWTMGVVTYFLLAGCRPFDRIRTE
ncbi:kinase-like domain-containing protein [Mycena epipterygia]|nr:kinase-like domain-containing protein [Mycena epipterygia]